MLFGILTLGIGNGNGIWVTVGMIGEGCVDGYMEGKILDVGSIACRSSLIICIVSLYLDHIFLCHAPSLPSASVSSLDSR